MLNYENRAEALRIRNRAVIVFLLAILAFVISGLSVSIALTQAQSSRETTPQQTVVGRDCRQCHQAIVESFALAIHGKSAKFLTDSRAAKCEICHANSEKHAETSTRTTSRGDVVNPAKLGSEQANETCLNCHSMDRSHFNWQGGKHDRSDMSCLSCHSNHHAKSAENMLTGFTVEETCLRCHKEIRKAIFQRSTHLFRTENSVATDRRQVLSTEPIGMKVNCTSCHNPHGGEGRKMLVDRTTNGVCYQCHAEKRGPLLWEHPPVQENCLTCHNPHGSNNVSLLTRRTHQLCQQCHIHLLPRHSTVAGFDVFTFNRSCTNCHSQIHGSNHPAGKTFTR